MKIYYSDIVVQLEELCDDMTAARVPALVASIGLGLDGSFVRRSFALDEVRTSNAREVLALDILHTLRPELRGDA